MTRHQHEWANIRPTSIIKKAIEAYINERSQNKSGPIFHI